MAWKGAGGGGLSAKTVEEGAKKVCFSFGEVVFWQEQGWNLRLFDGIQQLFTIPGYSDHNHSSVLGVLGPGGQGGLCQFVYESAYVTIAVNHPTLDIYNGETCGGAAF